MTNYPEFTITINPPLLMVAIGVRNFGVGWWVKGQWKEQIGWFNYGTEYYDGYWFAVRIGPFFYSCGPY